VVWDFVAEIRIQTVTVIEHGDAENYIIFWESAWQAIYVAIESKAFDSR